MGWKHQILQLWIAYLVWVRDYIFLLMQRQGNIQYAEEGLQRFLNDFEAFIAQFYGEENAKKLRTLLERHIDLLSEYTGTVHADEDIQPLRGMFYSNAAEIAQLLASLNPNWDETAWRELLVNQFYLEENMIQTLHQSGYADTAAQYDDIFDSIDQLVTYTVDGIEAQFG